MKELKPVGRPPKKGESMSFKLKSEVVEIIKKQPNQTAFVEESVIMWHNHNKSIQKELNEN